MPTYSNGRIPVGALVTLDTGAGRHLSTYASAVRWYLLRRNVQARTGVTLYISPGMNAYRDWDEQGVGRANACAAGNCLAAASQGYSSHGGSWLNQDAMAFDIGNYWAIPWSVFVEECARVGFETGLITRAIAGIEEPWHIIDRGSPFLSKADTDARFGVSLTRGADGVWRLTETQPLEDDEMLMLRVGGAHLVALGRGVFRHFLSTDPYEKIKNLARAADDWQDVSISEMPALLVTYGCDRNIWDIRDGKFVVLDPLDGTVKSGNAWTSEKVIRAAIAGLAVPKLDPTPIVEAVRKAIAEKSIDAPAVDEQAIARAVREEFRVSPLA